jgi:hypothetical protein
VLVILGVFTFTFNVVWGRAASFMGDFGPGGVEGRLVHR